MWDHICGALLSFLFFFFRARRGNRTPRSLFSWGGRRRWQNVYGYWRWPLSSCIRHTYYQISTTVQRFFFLFDQQHSQTIRLNYISSFFVFFWRWRKQKQKIYMPVCVFMYISIRPACFRGLLRYVDGGSLLWHGGSDERKKIKRKRGPTSALTPTWLHWM